MSSVANLATMGQIYKTGQISVSTQFKKKNTERRIRTNMLIKCHHLVKLCDWAGFSFTLKNVVNTDYVQILY